MKGPGSGLAEAARLTAVVPPGPPVVRWRCLELTWVPASCVTRTLGTAGRRAREEEECQVLT